MVKDPSVTHLSMSSDIGFKITVIKVFKKIDNMLKNFTRKLEFMKNKTGNSRT